jgi:general stress protein 26
MEKEFVYKFMRQHQIAVVSSITKNGMPQSALVGIAVSTDLEIVFDTIKTSRKYENIINDPSVALVIGWDDETTVQYEGLATELTDVDDHYREIYYSVYPDGRERAKTWPGLVHFKVSPRWIRYSNFNTPVVIEELVFP